MSIFDIFKLLFLIPIGVMALAAVLWVIAQILGRLQGGRPKRIDEREAIKAEMASLPNFSPDCVEFLDGGLVIALDGTNKKLFFKEGNGGHTSVLHYEQVLAVEITKNGSSVTKINRGSQVAGAAVGAVLFGPVGLLLGGLTGSRRTEEKVSKLAVKVYTNKADRPVRELVFYKGLPMPADQITNTVAARKMEEWYARLRAIVA